MRIACIYAPRTPEQLEIDIKRLTSLMSLNMRMQVGSNTFEITTLDNIMRPGLEYRWEFYLDLSFPIKYPHDEIMLRGLARRIPPGYRVSKKLEGCF